MARRYWLMKSEPNVFSIEDLARAPKQTTGWDGVRNYQARNLLRDEIKVGDGVLFYHSSADPPAVAGTAEVVRAGYPDPTQFDRKDDHFDPDSAPGEPRWYQVDVRALRKLPKEVPLPLIRETPAPAAACGRGFRNRRLPLVLLIDVRKEAFRFCCGGRQVLRLG